MLRTEIEQLSNKKESIMKKCRDGLAHIVNGIDKIERFLITVIFTEVIIVGFAQVVCRFILRASLPWSEELLRFSFIWLTYIASSMGIMAGTHANVTVLTDRLSVKAQKVLQVFIDLLTAFFCAVVFYFSITIIQTQIATNQISAAMRIPMYIPYAGITVSFGFMLIQCVARILNTITDISNTERTENVA